MSAIHASDGTLLMHVGDVEGHAHFRLRSGGEELLVWTGRSAKVSRPLIVYLHGASPRGVDVKAILDKGPDCPPRLLADGRLSFDADDERSAGEDGRLEAALAERRADVEEARSTHEPACIALAQRAVAHTESLILAERARRIAEGCVVVSPLLGAKSEWCKTTAQTERTMRVLRAFLDASRRGEHGLAPIDERRVFCTGASCGGLGSYTLACRLARERLLEGAAATARRDGPPQPPPFPALAAVAPVCGGGQVVYATLLKRTPAWFWHSASDSAVACADTEALVAALEDLDAPVKFTKLSDKETPPSPDYVAYMTHHNAWKPAYRPDSPLWPWLFTQMLPAPGRPAIRRL